MATPSEVISESGPVLTEAQAAVSNVNRLSEGIGIEVPVISQLESLLCRENVTCDQSLASMLRPDWSIPAEALITHPSLSHLQLSVEDLLQAAAASTTLTANFEALTVTPELKAKRTTVIIRELPEDVGEEELRQLLMQFPGDCASVQNGHSSPASTTDSPRSNSVTDSTVYPQKSTEGDLQILALRRDFGNSWFLTLADEDVTTAVAMWLRSQMFRGGDLLKVRVKSSVDLNASVCRLGRQHRGPPRPKKAPDADSNAVPCVSSTHAPMGEAPDGPNDLSYGYQAQCKEQGAYPVDEANSASGGAYAEVQPAVHYDQAYHVQQDNVNGGAQEASHSATVPHYVDISGAPIDQESVGCAQCDQQQMDACMNTAPCCDASGMYPCSGGYIAPADGAEYAYPTCGDSNCCDAGCTGWGGAYGDHNQVNDGLAMPVGGYQQGVPYPACAPDACGTCHTGESGVLQASAVSPCCMDAHGMVDHAPAANYTMDSQNNAGGKNGASFRGSRGRRRGGYGEWQGGRRTASDAYKQQHMVDDAGAVVEERNGAGYREYRRSDGNERRHHDGNKASGYDNKYYKSRNDCGPDGNTGDRNNNRGKSSNRKARGDWQPHRDHHHPNDPREPRMKKVVTPMTTQDFPSLNEAATLSKSSSLGKRSTATSMSFESVNERSRELGGGSRSGSGITNKRAFSPDGDRNRRGGRGHQRITWTLKDHMPQPVTSSSTTADSAEESAGKGKAVDAEGGSKTARQVRTKTKRGDNKKADKKERGEGQAVVPSGAAPNEVVVSVATGGFDSPSASGDLAAAASVADAEGLTAALDTSTTVSSGSPFAENLVPTVAATAAVA